jgi:hypothetical protein
MGGGHEKAAAGVCSFPFSMCWIYSAQFKSTARVSGVYVRTAQGLQDVKFGPVEAGRTECKVFTAAPDGVRVHLRQFASSNAMEFGPFQVPVGSTLELRAQNHLPFTGVMLRHPRR